ncbi:MAG: hypothetical protein S4CHLAM102_11450 [Chlamydiia bacterium]|nr:hypothetical protein [Chlamydiia bacterium]
MWVVGGSGGDAATLALAEQAGSGPGIGFWHRALWGCDVLGGGAACTRAGRGLRQWVWSWRGERAEVVWPWSQVPGFWMGLGPACPGARAPKGCAWEVPEFLIRA